MSDVAPESADAPSPAEIAAMIAHVLLASRARHDVDDLSPTRPKTVDILYENGRAVALDLVAGTIVVRARHDKDNRYTGREVYRGPLEAVTFGHEDEKDMPF